MDHERFEDFLYSLEDGLPLYLKEVEERALSEAVPIIRKSSQKLLRFFMRTRTPLRILEVGTAVGFSALLMAEYTPIHAKIVTIEKMPERIEKAKENFKLYDNEKKIELIEGDAGILLKEMASEGISPFDLIFVDAAKGQYLTFLPYVKSLLKTGGILIADNLLQEGRLIDSRYTIVRRERTIHKRMREFVKELFRSDEYETMILETGDGMSVSVKL